MKPTANVLPPDKPCPNNGIDILPDENSKPEPGHLTRQGIGAAKARAISGRGRLV